MALNALRKFVKRHVVEPVRRLATGQHAHTPLRPAAPKRVEARYYPPQDVPVESVRSAPKKVVRVIDDKFYTEV